MNITELNWSEDVKYRDNHNDIWMVEQGELLDESGINIYYSYTIKQISKLKFTQLKER